MRIWDVSDGSLVSELRVQFRIDNIAWSPSSVRIAVIDMGSFKLVTGRLAAHRLLVPLFDDQSV